MLKRENLNSKISLLSGSLSNESVEEDIPLKELFIKAYEADKTPQDILNMLEEGTTHSKKIRLAECEDRLGWLYFCDRLYIPVYTLLKLEIIRLHHDIPAAGHAGKVKTFNLLSRYYYWLKMCHDTDQCIRN